MEAKKFTEMIQGFINRMKPFGCKNTINKHVHSEKFGALHLSVNSKELKIILKREARDGHTDVFHFGVIKNSQSVKSNPRSGLITQYDLQGILDIIAQDYEQTI